MSMLKKLSVATVGAALIAVGILNVGEAQALGPDAYGYTLTDDLNGDGVGDEDDYQRFDLGSGSTQALSGALADDTSVTANIGFDFNFYGTNYNQVSISSNGLLTFGGENNNPNNVNFTSTAPGGTPGNRPSIAVLWDDWKLVNLGAEVRYNSINDQSGQRFIVEWSNVTGTDLVNLDPIKFQAVLFQGSNDIRLNYTDVGTAPSSQTRGRSATIGIRDIDGQTNNRNLQWSYRTGVSPNNTNAIFDNRSLLYSSPEAVPFEFSPGLSILALGGLFAAERLKSKLQKRKFSQSELSSN